MTCALPPCCPCARRCGESTTGYVGFTTRRRRDQRPAALRCKRGAPTSAMISVRERLLPDTRAGRRVILTVMGSLSRPPARTGRRPQRDLQYYRLDGAKAVRVVDGWNATAGISADGSLASRSGGSAFGGYSYYRYTSGRLQHLETLLYLDGGPAAHHGATPSQRIEYVTVVFHSVTRPKQLP